MSRYEDLQTKAELCRETARQTKGFMRAVWLKKANQLELLAANLPVVKARYEAEKQNQRGF